jgi:hypothetical protein
LNRLDNLVGPAKEEKSEEEFSAFWRTTPKLPEQ